MFEARRKRQSGHAKRQIAPALAAVMANIKIEAIVRDKAKGAKANQCTVVSETYFQELSPGIAYVEQRVEILRPDKVRRLALAIALGQFRTNACKMVVKPTSRNF